MTFIVSESRRPFGRQWGLRLVVILVIFLASIFVLGLTGYAMVVAFQHPYSGLSWSPETGEISAIAAQSPAAVAGLRAGDIVLAIDGVPRAEAALRLVSMRTGESIEFALLREGRTARVNLLVSGPTLVQILQRLTPLLISLCFALFGLFLWVFKPYDTTVVVFMILTQLSAAVLTVGLVSSLLSWPAIWFELCLALLSAMLVHFHLIFPRQKRRLSRWPSVLVVYALPLAFALASAQQYVLSEPLDISVLPGARSLFIGGAIAAASILIHTYLTAESVLERQHIRIIVAGTVVALVPLIGLALLPDLLLGTVFIPYEAAFIFLLGIPLTYAAAIRQHNLLRIGYVVNRCITHLILLLLITSIYALLTFAVIRLLSPEWVGRPFIWGAITLLIALVFTPLRDRLQAFVDRLFYGGWYDYHSVVGEMSRALNGVIDTRELARLLVEWLVERLRVRGALLLLITDDLQLHVTEAANWQSMPLTGISINSLLARCLCQLARPLAIAELRAAIGSEQLTNTELAWLDCSEAALWVPLVQRGALQGILLVNTRADGEAFDSEDRRILSTLANQTSTTFANIQLVEALRRRANEVKQLYSQLVHSRESERKRLARELHDQTIQELINIHYYLDETLPPSNASDPHRSRALREQIQRIIGQLRDVCTDLRPAALEDLSLDFILEGYIDECIQKYGLNIILELPDNRRVLEDLPEEVSLCLFRVLQEALANARRHARASRIQVTLGCDADHIIMEVADNGCGFELPGRLGSLIDHRHFGLVGAQERIALVQGTFEVESALGQGTTVRTRIPLEVKSEHSRLSLSEPNHT